ncbi:MAG TPA: hypothetical protein ENN92_00865 [candidate division WWE3 bacterium]|uniref:Uncharacterized protein n=1 Tax=candidate division WWE3 bacterium TaxID=2053526 RepID=A0A7C1DPJ4_UNCKA|nr:hypothetical protein [candidate division WWE3 bacterium]
MNNLGANKTVQKFILPLVAAMLLNYKSLIQISDQTNIVNLLIQVGITMAILMVLIKYVPDAVKRYLKRF